MYISTHKVGQEGSGPVLSLGDVDEGGGHILLHPDTHHRLQQLAQSWTSLPQISSQPPILLQWKDVQ